MNKSELMVKQKWENDGWKMLRGGAPDFFALKIEGGNIKEVRGVEVKYGDDKLRYEQEIVRKAFIFLGIPYVVEHIMSVHTSPTQTVPDQAKPFLAIPHRSCPGHAKPTQIVPCPTVPYQTRSNHSRPPQLK